MFNFLLSQDNNNTCFIVLQDGKNDWKQRKLKTEILSNLYGELVKVDYDLSFKSKQARCLKCGSYLAFKFYFAVDKRKLHEADFCQVRLCPMCSWRREMKIFSQLSKVMNIAEKDGFKFVFLTLTVRNCEGKLLDDTLNMMYSSFKKLQNRAKFKRAVKGFFRSLEITHNTNRLSKSFNTFHPHFHFAMIVNKSYFTSRDYIKTAEWVKMWRESCQLDYDPHCWIEKVKNKKITLENTNTSNKKNKIVNVDEDGKERVTRYVADSTFLEVGENGELEDKEMALELVRWVDPALKNRRLVAFGGKFREYHKLLNLDDPEKGNYIYIDGEKIREDLAYIIEVYGWTNGIMGKNYYKIGEKEEKQ